MTDCTFAGSQFPGLIEQLRAASAGLEPDADAWPAGQFDWLGEAGVLGWVIPEEFGGGAINSIELTEGYVRLASACLVTTFVLTQRNGACQRIAALGNETIKAELLPGLCRGELFATVGISHLTTSRQHLGKPAVAATPAGDGFVFDGTVPWVTGAKHADYVLTGGTCDDGGQLLAVIAADAEGVTINTPPKLLSMNASQTGSVTLDGVRVSRDRVIAGPVEQVMKQGSVGSAGSLTTSALAVGASQGTLSRLQAEAEKRPDLAEVCESLDQETSRLAEKLLSAAGDPTAAATSAAVIRERANSLVLRAAQAYLGATKGAGFIAGHPAERSVREALFFLVWSCPQPVLTAALREFACIG